MDLAWFTADQCCGAPTSSSSFSPITDAPSIVGSPFDSPGTSFSAPGIAFGNGGRTHWLSASSDAAFSGYDFTDLTTQHPALFMSSPVNSPGDCTSMWDDIVRPLSPFSEIAIPDQASELGFDSVPASAVSQALPAPSLSSLISPPSLQSSSPTFRFMQDPCLGHMTKPATESGTSGRRFGPERPPSEAPVDISSRKGPPGGRPLGSKLQPGVAAEAGKMREIGACWPCVFQRDKVDNRR